MTCLQIADRLKFFQLDPAEIALARDAWSLIEPALPAILEGFYRHVGRVPALAAIVGGGGSHT